MGAAPGTGSEEAVTEPEPEPGVTWSRLQHWTPEAAPVSVCDHLRDGENLCIIITIIRVTSPASE